MTLHISPSDISIVANDPRILDLKLGEALEFSQSRGIRKLIQRNVDELAGFGEVCAMVAQTPPEGGRPTQEYWLNEAQALLICMFARTENAARVRRELIEVFMAWRKGLTTPVKPAAFFPAAFDDAPTTAIAAKLSLVREARLIWGLKRAQSLWDSIGLPVPPLAEADAADEARDCLRALLYAETGEGRCLFERIAAALDGDTAQDIALFQWGVKTRGNGFIVANRHPWLVETFRGTAGDHNRWPYVLRRLPGIAPADKESFAGHVSRTSFVPGKYLDLGALPRSGA